ncbi:DNA polymerase beta superfamily protein [Calidifontibacillus oryziterrae]|uniref:DNA polymerase beta superfamily protein n=1 Tax=Calidifontibacillus oryziterrae TaxID=1191699 RepID=UPI000310FB87|nr:nucleotidyltransferase domain-containing protein [Calidifontibacillus oryziterrae]
MKIERKLCFKALVGSYNYNLNTKQSDKDYKIFFYPNFDDLYNGGQYSKALISTDEDVEFHDIRKLPSLLYKSNVNFMEVLFSEEYEIFDHDFFNKVIVLRDDISKINLPYLYDACYGMYLQKSKEFYRDQADAPIEKTCKHAMGAYRILDFLDRFHKNSFSSFKKAIQYNSSDSNRDLLLEIRNGKFNSSQLINMITAKESEVRLLEEVYKSFAANESLKEKVENLVKESVRASIKEEFLRLKKH